MKKKILLLALIVNFLTLNAQVNMSQGTMNFSVPIYGFADNVSKLSFNTQFIYSSGNGLEVDQVSNSIGTKWNLSGIPVITRTINGLPDDQIEKSGDVYNLTKYPPGYLYNNNPISLGCPTALSKYPIFSNSNIDFDNSNITDADRELDEFQFSLNGSSGSFVIDKNFNAIQLNDGRAKIEIITENQTVPKGIRTSIKEFDITDVDGLKYIFSEQETNKAFKISERNQSGVWFPDGIFSNSYDIPLNENPFITSTWYVSKIIDIKTNRFILFSYNTEINKYEIRSQLQTELSNQPHQGMQYGSGGANINGTSPNNHPYSVYAYNTKGTIIKKEIQKKQISEIFFPDESHIEFNYLNDRKDLADTKMLDNISVFDSDKNLLVKYNLEHSYFIKNELRNPLTEDEKKWSRLCLTEIKKTSNSIGIEENPWKFNYYTGTNNTEDFVPPYFFHAKDQWGYYNGNYSGVTTTNFLTDNDFASWTKVCIYNQLHGYSGGVDLYYTSKNGYAKNGLLKTVINPFGGTTEYQYEQNRCVRTLQNNFYSYDYDDSGESVGGVHIKKIIEKPDNQPANELTNEYIYTDNQGHSTMWGEESLKFQIGQSLFWRAEDKYFTGSQCKYRYLYPGNVFSTSSSGDDFKLDLTLASDVNTQVGTALHFRNGFKSISKMTQDNTNLGRRELHNIKKLRGAQLKRSMVNTSINLVLQYLIGILISCAQDAPAALDSKILTLNTNTNTNLLQSQFKQVTRKDYSGGLQAGKTVFEFTSNDDFPLILSNESDGFSQKPRAYQWMYGLPKSVKYYDNASTLLKSTENEYALKKVDVQDAKTSSCNCESYWSESLRSDQWNTTSTFNEFTNVNTYNSYGIKQKVDPYNITTGHYELKKTTEKTYNQFGDNMVSVTDYLYNPNNLLASQISGNSKGTTIETKTYYVEDYNLSNPSNLILSQMKNDNILTVPISTETWQTRSGNSPELLSTSITEFGVAPNGDYKPKKIYSLQTDKPVPLYQIGTFNPNQLIRNALIAPQTEITYDDIGNAVQTKDLLGARNSSILYSYGSQYPVASISNATVDQIAYTSFEAFGQGHIYNSNWDVSNAEILTESTPTGNKCCSLKMSPYQSQVMATISISQDYKLSLWSTSNSFTINNIFSPTLIGPTINGWTYYEFNIPQGSAAPIISGNNCKIDELRLYPKKSSMTTTTYNYGIGKTSECDINNRITYYEYDDLGRISKVMDERHNIIKTYEYHFKN